MERPTREATDDAAARISAAALPSVVRIHARRTADTLGSATTWADAYITDTATTSARGLICGGGTGVIISADGLVLTSGHVLDDALSVVVELADGRLLNATHIAAATDIDLAVIRVDAVGLAPIADCNTRAGTARDCESAPRGCESGPHADSPLVVAIGALPAADSSPNSSPVETGTVRIARGGVITNETAHLSIRPGPCRQRHYDELIESTALIGPGFSGGPLLDADGRLIGIDVAIAGFGASRRAYAVPLDDRRRTVVQALCARLRSAATIQKQN